MKTARGKTINTAVSSGTARCLITGFKPFKTILANTSESVLHAVSECAIRDADIHSAVLPVQFTRSARTMTGLLDRYRPHVVLMLGINRNIPALAIEKMAVNSYDKSTTCKDLLIDPEGPPAFFTNYPVKDLLRALKRREVPTFLSYHAGTYVCNYLFYTTARYLSDHAPGTLYGFIRLPGEAIRQGAQKHASMELPTILTGIEVVLKKLVGQAQKIKDNRTDR